MRPDSVRSLAGLASIPALLFALSAALWPVSVAAEAPRDDPTPCPIDGALAGVWVAEDGETMIRFYDPPEGGDEPLYATVENGRLEQVAPIVTCEPDHVETCYFGRRHRLDVSLDADDAGDHLEVHHRSRDMHRTYWRSDGVPEIFEPEPLDLPEPRPVPEERVATIQAEMAERHELDQGVRQQPIDGEEMMRVDADNTAYLKELIGEVGWIDPERFGDEAARTAFLIVQHSGDVPLMMAALPHLRAHRLPVYALLYDRLQLRLGGEQRYGSQIGWTEDGTKGLLPIEILEGIDERRAEVELGPLSEYLALFEIEEPRVLTCGEEWAPSGPGRLLRLPPHDHDRRIVLERSAARAASGPAAPSRSLPAAPPRAG